MKEKVIIIGDGGHAKVVLDIIMEMERYEIIGVTSLQKNIKEFYGFPVLGNDEVLLDYYKKGIKNVAIGIGGFTNNEARKKIFNNLVEQGFNIINAIHPNSVISRSVVMGKGVVIFAGAVINPEVRLGNNVIIATGATIDHESNICNHCLISAGVTIGANDKIGEGTLCALGSKVISEVNIGSNVLVAAGAVVVSDIEDNLKVFGIPAKKRFN